MQSAQVVADVIERLVRERGLSVSKLLVECGLSSTTIADMKRKGSMPAADKMCKIAQRLGVTMEYLLTGDESPSIYEGDLTVNVSHDSQREYDKNLSWEHFGYINLQRNLIKTDPGNICILCGRPSNWEPNYVTVCPNCGYYINREGICDSVNTTDYELLSGHIREKQTDILRDKGTHNMPLGEYFVITKDWRSKIKESFRYASVKAKAEKLLLYIDGHTGRLGERLIIPIHPAICYAKGDQEFACIVETLKKEGYIHFDVFEETASFRISLTYEGRVRAEDLKNKQARANTVFISMWFNDQAEWLYDCVFEPAVRIASDRQLRAVTIRQSDRADTAGGGLPEKIILDLKECRAVFADLTGNRAEVYHEIGVADGLEKRVLLSCGIDWFKWDYSKYVEDEFKRNEIQNLLQGEIHFNVRHRDIHFWTLDEGGLVTLAKRTAQRIRAYVLSKEETQRLSINGDEIDLNIDAEVKQRLGGNLQYRRASEGAEALKIAKRNNGGKVKDTGEDKKQMANIEKRLSAIKASEEYLEEMAE